MTTAPARQGAVVSGRRRQVADSPPALRLGDVVHGRLRYRRRQHDPWGDCELHRTETNDLGHPLSVLDDAGLIRRESDAFAANRSHFQISEPLLSFYHVMM